MWEPNSRWNNLYLIPNSGPFLRGYPHSNDVHHYSNLLFDLKVTGSLVMRLGSSPVKDLAGIESKSFWFWEWCLHSVSYWLCIHCIVKKNVKTLNTLGIAQNGQRKKMHQSSKDVSGAQEKILRQTDQFIEVFLILLCFLNCLIKQNQCLSKLL